MTQVITPEVNGQINLDYYVFKYIAQTLKGKTPEQIVAFYVDKLIFKNGDYFKSIMEQYHLPNDILRVHAKICKLVEA